MKWEATFPLPHDDKTCPVCSPIVHSEAYKRGVAEALKNQATADAGRSGQ